MRETAVDTMERASAATRRAATGLEARTAALGHRGADMLATAAESIHARPVTAVLLVAALAGAAAGALVYLACRERE
jgi:hypothetical protein